MDDKKTFLRFVALAPSPSGKTQRWDVRGKISGAALGTISWYAAWRRYAFYPNSQTVFDFGCLNQIAEFIETLMGER